MKDRLIQISPNVWKLPKYDSMNVDGILFASEQLLDELEPATFLQVKNVASLPGIVSDVMAMPDMHYGYGFPIGGVAAFDQENGIITPGGIGFDINCGVRLLTTPLNAKDIEPKIFELIDVLFRNVPSGVGSESKLRISDDEYDQILEKGASWAVANGYGISEDLILCEEEASMKGGDASKVTPRAKSRGRKQLGTLGAGNHFLEVQYVDEIYDKNAAKAFGITHTNQVMVMIHCGSRGLGHQVCSDYLRKMEDTYPEIVAKLPEKDLIYAPISSRVGQDYFSAMVCAANYAWCNRHIIAHYVRQSFKSVFGIDNMRLVYDVAHNIAKREVHTIGSERRKVIMHRKGATRAFPPHHDEIPQIYKEFGQPVIIPGSMGTASYLLVGTDKGMQVSMGSASHGAGRTMSRHAAMKKFSADEIRSQLKSQKIYIKAASKKGISEEAPQCYKAIDEVIKTTNEAGLARKVVKLRPLGVIKG